MAQDAFAFGDNEIAGTECVAMAAGFRPDNGGVETTVAERYDEIVRQRYDLDEGVLPASVAKSCWNEAVESLRRDLQLERDDEHADWLSDAITVGETIEAKAF